ncbi:MAG TPA: DUF1850 domain-containing protein [Rectinemataceae bacterium]|nr:DUF1850 domain-containing protein [Rectinemataceae bacterium]
MKKRIAIAASALAAALVAVLVLSLCVEPELVLRDGQGRFLAALHLPKGRFEHVFVHSFHLTPVEEDFRVERRGLFRAGLRLTELRYQDLGTGMPEDAELGYRLEKGVFILTMDRRFDRIPIMVSILDGHGIVVDGVFHPFTDWVPKEGRIILEGRFVPAIRFRR